MSRLARKSIVIPNKVKIEHKDNSIIINGVLGTLVHKLHDNISLHLENNMVTVLRKDDSNLSKALQGTTYVIISNNIKGVSEGFVKKLQLQGVGYKAKIIGNKIDLEIGQSKHHKIEYIIPTGVKAEVPSVTEIVISGPDKQLVGQVAANLRRLKEPEPYKGKGIRYSDEVIKLKEFKKKK